jgi:hypothetical protein
VYVESIPLPTCNLWVCCDARTDATRVVNAVTCALQGKPIKHGGGPQAGDRARAIGAPSCLQPSWSCRPPGGVDRACLAAKRNQPDQAIPAINQSKRPTASKVTFNSHLRGGHTTSPGALGVHVRRSTGRVNGTYCHRRGIHVAAVAVDGGRTRKRIGACM